MATGKGKQPAQLSIPQGSSSRPLSWSNSHVPRKGSPCPLGLSSPKLDFRRGSMPPPDVTHKNPGYFRPTEAANAKRIHPENLQQQQQQRRGRGDSRQDSRHTSPLTSPVSGTRRRSQYGKPPYGGHKRNQSQPTVSQIDAQLNGSEPYRSAPSSPEASGWRARGKFHSAVDVPAGGIRLDEQLRKLDDERIARLAEEIAQLEKKFEQDFGEQEDEAACCAYRYPASDDDADDDNLEHGKMHLFLSLHRVTQADVFRASLARITVLQEQLHQLRQQSRGWKRELQDTAEEARNALIREQFAAQKEDEAIQKVHSLEETIQQLHARLTEKNECLLWTMEDNEAWKVQDAHFSSLIDALDGMQKTSCVDGLHDTEILKSMTWTPTTSRKMVHFHSRLVAFVQQTNNHLRGLVVENQRLHKDLGDQEKKLARGKGDVVRAKAELEARARQKAAAGTLNGKFEEQRDEWRKLYELEVGKRREAEHMYQKCKAEKEALAVQETKQRDTELDKEISRLQGHVQSAQKLMQTTNATHQADMEQLREALQDKIDHAQEQAKELAAQAQNWRTECQLVKLRADKDAEGYKAELWQKNEDLITCTKQYDVKRRDSAFWDFENLHKTVRTLERDQELTKAAFDRVKLEKCRLEEDAIPRLVATIRQRELEIVKLKSCWAKDTYDRACSRDDALGNALDRIAEYAVPLHASSDSGMENGDRTAPAATRTKFKYVPRCLSPEETAKREKALNALREAQAKRRGEWDFRQAGSNVVATAVRRSSC
ncbi:hypothetical protein ACEQ8H_003767 [Pleosporales sp. CAS-2024a]